MNILITGGAGFIGSHLSDYLLVQGHRVVVIDDLSTGSMDNLREARKSRLFQYHVDTIFNRQLLAEVIDDADVVFHLAAAVGVRNIVESPVRTIETNVGGSELVLEFSAKKGKRVLIASTSEVYGKSAKIPFNEDDDLLLGPTSKARWSYACSKMVDEFLALAYYREHKLPVTVVRLFNTVGPRQTGRYGMVLPTFVQQALAGEPITVFGTGEQSRCFGYVGDIIRWTDDVHRFGQNRGRGVQPWQRGRSQHEHAGTAHHRGHRFKVRDPAHCLRSMRTHRASKIWSVAFLTSPKRGTGSDSIPRTHWLTFLAA